MSLPFDPSPVALVAVAWAITYALHSTILLGVAWLLEQRFADKPELMSPIWKAAVIGGAVSATLQLAFAVEPLGGRWAVAAEERVAAAPERFTGGASIVADELAVTPVLAVALALEVPLAPVPPSAPDVTMPASSPWIGEAARPVVGAPQSTMAARAALGLFALWIIGGLALVIGLVRSWLALRRVLHGRLALRTGALADALERLHARASVTPSVRLSMSTAIRVPLATGVLHPEIVVPRRAVSELAPSAQESMLAHELGHVVRRDPTWRLGLALAQRVLFFQPLLGVAGRRIAQHAEYLADAWAARHTAEPLALARCLTEIAAWIRSAPPTSSSLALASGMAGPVSILGRRVLRLVEAPPTPPRRHALALALVCAAVPALAWIAPGASWAHDEPAVLMNAEAMELAQLAELDAMSAMQGEVFPVVIEGDRARAEQDALQRGEAPRAVAARSVDDAKKARRSARKAERAANKDRAAARRDAQRDIKRAFRSAQRHDTLPEPERIAAIIAQARSEADASNARSHVIVHGDDHQRIVVERDGEHVIVKKNGKVVAKSGGKGRARAKQHGRNHEGGIDVQVLDHDGNVVHIEIPRMDLERLNEQHRDLVERALRDVHRAREHIEGERARIHMERDRIREQLRRQHVVPRGHAPRAPQPPRAPGFRGEIVPISNVPAAPPMPAAAPWPPMPPEAMLAPLPPMPPLAPMPELEPLAPAPPAPPAAPAARPRAPNAPKKAAPRARPGCAPIVSTTSA
jgi:beta-lactamase regulating signal transducer with metallopeptidase domain